MNVRQKVKVIWLGTAPGWLLWCPICRIGDIRHSWRSAFDGANRHAGYHHVSEPPC